MCPNVGAHSRTPVICGVQQPGGRRGVQHHQFANNTQLRLAMAADNTAGGLSIFAACTADVRLWYMQNGLQLNPDKLEALIIGTTTQLHAVTAACVVGGCCRRRTTGGRRDEGSGRCSGPASDI